MKSELSIKTGVTPSHHDEFTEVCGPGSEFSFHPWLASEIRKRIAEHETSLQVREYSCEDSSCPVNETWIEVYDRDLRRHLKTIRISRKKNLISKLDVSLSFQKQGI
ncbi:hypothetical protein EHO60_12590 [Leptospira fletcheri]|uniref:Uncharacterized protein n=2 Tax=Leptospira fletcheri TaxID=2484981 RepID=A0A4R9GD17_9LEPT|nr:hypothetical protein EHO60_12590 [Leptospira fletcheri]